MAGCRQSGGLSAEKGGTVSAPWIAIVLLTLTTAPALYDGADVDPPPASEGVFR